VIVYFFYFLCAFWLIGYKISSITSSIKNLAIEVDTSARPTASLSPRSHVVPEPGASDSTSRSAGISHSGRHIAPDLPPPDSDQWQVMEMPPPPPRLPNDRTGRQKKK
jgi:hypothetical protein